MRWAERGGPPGPPGLHGTPHRAAIAGALAALAQPLLVGADLKAVRTGGSVAGPAALLAVLFALDAAFSGLQGYLMGGTGEGVILGVR